ELRDAFNKELKKITSDEAEFVRLLKPYGFGASEVPPANLRTATLCKA
ncbi:ectoine/hydroxyectoine ABC transporter substrate-binding protein EhuB, partial [Streptomyces sp. SID11233]|nr:ectoine/hydroxyectoine ABC transporter substrate-binding protein EhuB [Streptomyces sp. SID11233]